MAQARSRPAHRRILLETSPERPRIPVHLGGPDWSIPAGGPAVEPLGCDPDLVAGACDQLGAHARLLRRAGLAVRIVRGECR